MGWAASWLWRGFCKQLCPPCRRPGKVSSALLNAGSVLCVWLFPPGVWALPSWFVLCCCSTCCHRHEDRQTLLLGGWLLALKCRSLRVRPMVRRVI